MNSKKIGIVGGGFAGLTLGYELSKAGYQVTIFEKEKKLGGLASSFKIKGWTWSLDCFYRHVFAKDKDFLNLVKELGVEEKVIFNKPLSSVYYQDKIYPFDSATSILKFPHLSIFSRLYFGAGVALLKYLPYFSFYEKKLATKVLPIIIGREGYEKIWKPLLTQKFGKEYQQIPLSWFWARIKARTSELGYYQGSFSKLANLLAKNIIVKRGKIKKNFEVEKIKNINERIIVKGKGKIYSFDKVILTTPLSVSLDLGGDLLSKEKAKFGELKTLGAAVLILRLRRKFLPDNTYWLNILKNRWPFVAAVEHTNFINPKYYNEESLVYLGGYYDKNNPIFEMNKDQVLKKFLPFAKELNLRVEKAIIETHFYKNLNAQPIPTLNYSKKAPQFKTSTPNLYWLTLHHIQPWDRGVNFAVQYAKDLAKLI